MLPRRGIRLPKCDDIDPNDGVASHDRLRLVAARLLASCLHTVPIQQLTIRDALAAPSRGPAARLRPGTREELERADGEPRDDVRRALALAFQLVDVPHQLVRLVSADD